MRASVNQIRSFFEPIVKNVHRVESPFNKMVNVFTWWISVSELDNRIYLSAITSAGVLPYLASDSFPDFKSAYRALVRL